MSNSEKKAKAPGKAGKIVFLILTILFALAFAGFVAALVFMIVKHGSEGKAFSDTVQQWFVDNLGIKQHFSIYCGMVLQCALFSLGFAFVSFSAFKYFREVNRSAGNLQKKTIRKIFGVALSAILVPVISLIIGYVGLIALNALFGVQLEVNGDSGINPTAWIIGFIVYVVVFIALGIYAIIAMNKKAKAYAAAGGEEEVAAEEPAEAIAEEVAVEESAAEEVKEEEKEEPAAVAEEAAAEEAIAEEPAAEVAAAAAPAGKTAMGYDRSFTGKLMQTKDETKAYYSSIKNAILSYKGKGKKISDRISWKYETFNIGRNKVVKIKVKGKTLCVYLALDPKTYIGTKYKVQDVSKSKADGSTPLMYRINNARRAKYVLTLIAAAMENYAFAINENAATQDYAKGLKYMNDAKLVKEGLAKKVAVSGFPKSL
ncbi:MAG: hypothetical protein J5697_02790 [Clostridia bacterium]|nr:hypothetical protein [Clostridia bacterium]